MRPSTLTRMHASQKEDREIRLKDLIAKNIALHRTNPIASEYPTVYRLIARSPDSPAARALAHFAEEAESLGIEIEVLFSHSAGAAIRDETTRLSLSMCRYLSDRRLLDAHEQLVLGTDTTWIGDCLRREPGKRNTYEFTREACSNTASQAAHFHNQLARSSLPAKTNGAPLSHPGVMAQELVDASMIATSLSAHSNALSRH